MNVRYRDINADKCFDIDWLVVDYLILKYNSSFIHHATTKIDTVFVDKLD